MRAVAARPVLDAEVADAKTCRMFQSFRELSATHKLMS